MSVLSSKCLLRRCKHYLGVSQPNEDELTEFHHCPAFPNGIPDIISNGQNLHSTKYKDQETNIVFEKIIGEEADG